MSIIQTEKFIKSDTANNNNKVWLYELHDNFDVTCKWGRIGDDLSSLTKNFSSKYDAEKFIEKKKKEKLSARNGEVPYKKIETLGDIQGSNKTSTIDNSKLSSIATKQIKYNNPLVEDLIKYLTKVNAHNICAATEGAITYNETTGLFSTPIGIITQSNIDEANKVLIDISDLVANKDFQSQKLKQLTNDYLNLVPTNFGRKRLDIQDFWYDLSKVQAQKQILDGLQTSYATALATPKKTDDSSTTIEEPKVFDLQMNLLEDKKEYKRLVSKYESTKKDMHVSAKYKVKQIFTVCIASERKRFEMYGKQIGNVMELFHGSSAANLISIMKGGLVIPPSSSPHVCGRLYGNGTYFAINSSKSLNYSIGYWGGKTTDRVFMFIADVAMGNPYIPGHGPYPMNGYDSTWAKAGKSGVINDECIIYDLKQCTLKYLLELEK